MIAHILEIVGAWIVSVISASGYPGVMLLMAIESACIPLPSEIIMPFSGYLVYTGRFSLLAVATWGALGCNLGSVLAYEIGYFGGRPLVERYGRYIFLSHRELNIADRFFEQRGSHRGADRPTVAGDPHLHRAARRHRAHAATQVSHLHLHWIVALVFHAGLHRHAAGRSAGIPIPA